MALLWAEGFEAFGANAGDTQDGLEEKYISSQSGISGFTVEAGRTTGLCLELDDDVQVKTGAVLSGNEQTAGFGFRRVSGSATIIFFRLFFNALPSALWDLRALSTGDLRLHHQLNIVATATGALPHDGNWHYIHAHYLIDAVGFFRVYVDGVLVINHTGDTRGAFPEGPATQITRFSILGEGGCITQMDDLYIASGELRINGVVETLFPDGDGNANAFTPSAGSNWQNVDEAPFDGDTTYNESSGAGQIDQFDVDPITTAEVYGVHLCCMVKSTSGSALCRPVIRSGGVDYPFGSDISISTSYTNVNYVADLDPDVSGAWTDTSVNLAEFGIKAIS